MADLGLALGDAGLEQLLDARQAGGDVHARGDAAGVERPHGQLRPGLADRLGGDDADRLTRADHLAGGEVAAVACPADAVAGFAGEWRADEDLVDAGRIDPGGGLFHDQLVAIDQEGRLRALLGLDPRIGQRGRGQPADETLLEGALLVARLAPDDPAPLFGAAVLLAGDDVLRDVDQTPGEVPGVGRPQGRIGEALAGAVGGDEVLEDGHALAEVAADRDVDDPAGRVGHQAAHGAQLADVALVPAGAGRRHHRDRTARVERPHHLVRHGRTRLLPHPDDLLVALVLGDEAALELAVDGGDGLVRRVEAGGLVLRDLDVEQADGHATARRELEADALDPIDEMGRLLRSELAIAHVDELLEVGATHDRVMEAQGVGQDLVEDDPADGGPATLQAERRRLGIPGLDLDVDQLVERGAGLLAQLVAEDRLVLRGERPDRLALDGLRVHGQVVAAEDHVLGRRHDRAPVGRRQQVGRRQHHRPRFFLGGRRQRHVDRHLVAVEVGVEGRADERVDLDGRALDEDRHERLDAQAVEGRGAVEQDRDGP